MAPFVGANPPRQRQQSGAGRGVAPSAPAHHAHTHTHTPPLEWRSHGAHWMCSPGEHERNRSIYGIGAAFYKSRALSFGFWERHECCRRRARPRLTLHGYASAGVHNTCGNRFTVSWPAARHPTPIPRPWPRVDRAHGAGPEMGAIRLDGAGRARRGLGCVGERSRG